MIIDELVTILGFKVPADAQRALTGVGKSVSGITDRIKSLGVVSAVTSGIFAAFSVNAARDARSLANLSQSTGVTVKEIEALGAVYRQVGGDAKDFASDAEAFRRTWGQELNLEKMIDLSRDFVGLSEQNAFLLGRSFGFSDSMIRALMKGPDALRRMGDEAKKYNTTSESGLNNLLALNDSWTNLKNIITPLANDVQGGIAPALTTALGDFAQWLKENKDDIVTGANAVGEGLSRAWEKAKETGVAVKEALKPAWDVLDRFVKDNGGWSEAISSVTAVLAGLAMVSIPLRLISRIMALTGALTGLNAGASGAAAAIGAGGPLLLAFAALAAAAYVYRDEIGGVVDGINMKFDGFIQKTKDFQAAAKSLTDKDRKDRLDTLQQNHVGASGRNAAETVYGTVKTAVTTLGVRETAEALTAGLRKQAEMNKEIGNAIRSEVAARAGEEIASGMDETLGGRGWAGSSRAARGYAEIIAEHEQETKPAPEQAMKSVPVRRPVMGGMQRASDDLYAFARDDGQASGGAHNSVATNQTTINVYPTGGGDWLADIFREAGGMPYGVSASR